MFDCHCHILPGLDDGAQDLDTALAMGRMAVAGGTTTVFATPHIVDGEWRTSWTAIVDACTQLQDVFDKQHIGLRVLPGCEFFMDMELLPLLQGPGAYCLNEGKYLLVELPATQVPAYAEDFLFTVQARGITPVLAHVERYAALQQEPERLEAWVEQGLVLQVNASSFVGKNGERAQRRVEMLLRKGQIHLLGSDAHSARTRHPNMEKALSVLRTMGGADVIYQLLTENPQQVADGEEMASMPVMQQVRRRNWLSRLIDYGR